MGSTRRIFAGGNTKRVTEFYIAVQTASLDAYEACGNVKQEGALVLRNRGLELLRSTKSGTEYWSLEGCS